MTKRKLLFIVFTNEPCKRNHAFMHALDLATHGHTARILLEGQATRCVTEQEGTFGELFKSAKDQGILLGACKTASRGCATNDPTRNVASLAEQQGITLLEGMNGHASIAAYVEDGFEVVVY